MSDFIAGAVMIVAVTLLGWGVAIAAGMALWHAVHGVHWWMLLAGMR